MLNVSVDLLLWTSYSSISYDPWPHGVIYLLPADPLKAFQYIEQITQKTRAEFLLLWSSKTLPPTDEVLRQVIQAGSDIAHGGLALGMGDIFVDLQLFMQDWSMINASAGVACTSWRVSLDACLIRTSLLQQAGAFDRAFLSRAVAGLDLGYRSLKCGAIVEHRPELTSCRHSRLDKAPPIQDLYTFVLRHYGRKWANYVFFRRILCHDIHHETRARRNAEAACAKNPAPPKALYQLPEVLLDLTELSKHQISVIIPTLGRYKYIRAALESLRHQTVRPFEIIIVDQNPPESRQAEVYKGFEDLNLRVFWQDERGQSLARNTGLAAAQGTYVYFFDDDSIAYDDAIEVHLRSVLGGYHNASTGVSYPPPPDTYELPPAFRHKRIAQTFDTGNSFLATDLARRIGGFDRNYDFGPGTDADFGTRLYLAGERILHNPNAIRIHYKAPSGGLRAHGSHKYNTDPGLLSPFPPPTQSYYGLRYLSPAQCRERDLLQFITSKLTAEVRKSKNIFSKIYYLAILIVYMLVLPFKRQRSRMKAAALLSVGPRFGSFSSSDAGKIDPLLKSNEPDCPQSTTYTQPADIVDE